MSQHFDLIVIGSGPAAVQAAKLKKSVLVVERGGASAALCATGTIPSTTLRETVLNLSGWRERGFYGRAHRNKDDITAEDLPGVCTSHAITRSMCSNTSRGLSLSA